jgi:hypothetical protein
MAYALRFRALLVCALVWSAAGCDDPTSSERSELNANRQLWASQEIVSYRYQYRLNCFCGGPGAEPVAIEVSDGEVVRVTLQETGEDLPPSELSDYPTIDDLFELIDNWLSLDPYDARAEYHDELGYPVDVFIDFIENAIDEELGFVASGLVEL